MSATQLIERYRIPLIVAGIAFLLMFAAELYYLHGRHSVTLHGAPAFLVLLPPIGSLACFFALSYRTCVGKPSAGRALRIALFWLVAGGMSLILLDIIWKTLAANIG